MEESMSALNAQPRINWRRRVAAALILITLAMPFAAGEAFAEPPKDPAAGTPYQAYLADGCVEGSNFCKFVSEIVPDGTRLEIQRVACQGWHVNAVAPTFVVINELRDSANAFLGRIDFLDTKATAATWGHTWSISEQTLMFIPAGNKLQITLNSGTTGVGSYGCTISGYSRPLK
jgi:hypothetical protein